MSLATPPSSHFTPTAFSQCLLEATTADTRRDAAERTQVTSLLSPFTGVEVDGLAFETALQDHQRHDATLGPTAREVLALWRLCSRYPASSRPGSSGTR